MALPLPGKYCARHSMLKMRLGAVPLVEVPDAGHWLLHEEPELTSREMIEFFGQG